MISSLMWHLIYFSACVVLGGASYCNGFSQHRANLQNTRFAWHLYMGKGLNKQAELRRKMEIAKQQKAEEEGGQSPSVKAALSSTGGDDSNGLSAQEIKERNDRLRFEELLKKSSASVLNDYSSNGYLNKQQEEEEIDAQRKGIERLFEGDPAPTECFQELYNVRTETAIGKTGMLRLVPWLNSKRPKDYLVCLVDPRMKSPDLRQSVKTLKTELPSDIWDRLVVINADSPAENRRWMKRSDFNEENIQLYCDEKMDWMRAYTALGDKRWSMSMFVIADGKVQKLARDIDSYAVSRVVQNAVQAFKSEAKL